MHLHCGWRQNRKDKGKDKDRGKLEISNRPPTPHSEIVALTDSIVPIMYTPAVPTPNVHPPTIAREAARRRMKESAEWLVNVGIDAPHITKGLDRSYGIWETGAKRNTQIQQCTDTDTDRHIDADNAQTIDTAGSGVN